MDMISLKYNFEERYEWDIYEINLPRLCQSSVKKREWIYRIYLIFMGERYRKTFASGRI